MIEAPTCCFMLHSSPGRGISSFTLGWGRRQPTGEGSDASEESAATTPVPGNLRTELHHPRNAATQGHNALESPGARRLALPECQPTTAASLAREIARVTEHGQSRTRQAAYRHALVLYNHDDGSRERSCPRWRGRIGQFPAGGRSAPSISTPTFAHLLLLPRTA